MLIGAWAEIENRRKILDVGTGCGVIALMCCQRNGEAEVVAIDIDDASLEEASENFINSPWSKRLRAVKKNYSTMTRGDFDYIISNPPYFSAGISEFGNSRIKARHQGELSPVSLLRNAPSLLVENGGVGLIIPVSELSEVLSVAKEAGLKLSRWLYVKGTDTAPVKRVLIEFIKTHQNQELNHKQVLDIEKSILILESAPGKPTDDYRTLCKDFYLKF